MYFALSLSLSLLSLLFFFYKRTVLLLHVYFCIFLLHAVPIVFKAILLVLIRPKIPTKTRGFYFLMLPRVVPLFLLLYSAIKSITFLILYFELSRVELSQAARSNGGIWLRKIMSILYFFLMFRHTERKTLFYYTHTFQHKCSAVYNIIAAHKYM